VLTIGKGHYSKRKSISDVDTKKIEAVLGIHESAENDLKAVRSRVMEGTCQWISRRSEFVEWIEAPEKPGTPRTFWLIGLPATGKTVLASVIINHLQFQGHECQYHFFSASHRTKRTAVYCLRSIASQLAHTNEEFRNRLLTLSSSSRIAFNSQNQSFDLIWEKIFEGIIFKMKSHKTLFWVLDAVDEVDSLQLLLCHFLKIQSSVPIKFLFTSRPMKLPLAPAGCNSLIRTFFLSERDTNDDIRLFVKSAVQDALPDDERIREDIMKQILSKASGSFLWVRLALEMLQDNWHTLDDIRNVLTGVPQGMVSLYRRMLDNIKSQPPRLQLMAKRILTWAVCSWRPLNVDELRVALEPEFKGFVSLQDTIVQICSHFISVDDSKISLTHASARDFLLNDIDGVSAFVNRSHGHEYIATTCLNHLSNDGWRRTFKSFGTSSGTAHAIPIDNRLVVADQGHPLLSYATCYWAYHVSKSRLDSEGLMRTLKQFLLRYSLIWVEAVSLSSDLRYLTRSAKYLKTYAKELRISRLDGLDPPVSLKLGSDDYSKDIQHWAIDFIRIVGKFGPNLVQSPPSIYRLVPRFVPTIL